MAALRVSKNEIACVSQENIIVYKIGNSEKQIHISERPKVPDPKEKKQPQGNEEGRDLILCCGFSPSGRYFASCDDYKQLTIWLTDEGPNWRKLSTRTLIRRPTSLIFTHDESAILVGDKSGDVYSYSSSGVNDEGTLRLGHVSMLLDMVLCDNGRLLATSDRDDKIRVSHYPNGYNVQSYCLGHTDFVSCLGYFEEENVLVSGSGDGTLRLWDPRSGKQLAITSCREKVEPYVKRESTTEEESLEISGDTEEVDWKTARAKAAEANQPINLKCLSCCRMHNTVTVGFDRLPLLLIYKFNGTTLTFDQKIDLDEGLWDLCTDGEGRLWTLQAKEGRPLVVYQRTTSDGQMERMGQQPGNDDGLIATTVQAVNDNWDLLKGSLEQESIFSVLHKVKMDNIAVYQQQKEKKMRELQQRYKEKQERRKRNKHVLPPGECQQSEPGNNQASAEAPSSESDKDEIDEDSSDEVTKKIKVSDSS